MLRRLDPAGEEVRTQWDPGATGDDGYRGLAIDPSGAMYAVGFQPDPGVPPWPPSYVQGLIRRLDASGNVTWSQGWPGTGNGDDIANDVAIDAAGNAIVAGVMVDAGTATDAWVAAYSPAGALLWSDVCATAGADEANGVAIAPDGRIAIVGRQDGVAWIAIYDDAHVLLDEQTFPDVARWSAAAFDDDGDLVVTGGDATRKLDPDGAVVWARTAAGFTGRDVAIDHAGNVIAVGEIDTRIALVEYFQ
jgi:hypothetical protein